MVEVEVAVVVVVKPAMAGQEEGATESISETGNLVRQTQVAAEEEETQITAALEGRAAVAS
jgi:hypothetical protein